MSVIFLDTSVLCELIGVPGMDSQRTKIDADFRLRVGNGEQFVIPVTAVIETGNHIEQAAGDRRAAAERFIAVLRAAVEGRKPFRLWRVAWDDAFIGALCDGNSTHQTFVDLAGNGLLGAGDVAILVERDRFIAETAYKAAEVEVWTLDNTLRAYS
jgi:cytochrome P450